MMSKASSPAVIHGIGFNAHRQDQEWWQIVTNTPFQHAYPVGDRVWGDVAHIKAVLQERGRMYLAGRPAQPVKRVRKQRKAETDSERGTDRRERGQTSC